MRASDKLFATLNAETKMVGQSLAGQKQELSEKVSTFVLEEQMEHIQTLI
jgi:hypothetical protein